MASFASRLGLSWRSVAVGHNVEAIATLSGLDPGALSRTSPITSAGDRTVVIAGEVVALGDWTMTVRRFCPACLAEDVAASIRDGRASETVAFHRLIWNVSSIERCPTHRLNLLSACPTCRSSLGWRHQTVLRCPKGCSLAIGGGRGDRDVRMDTYFAGRLGGGERIPHPHLDQLPYRRAVGLCERVGRLASVGWQERLSRQSSEADAVARRAGFDMMLRFPEAVLDALDEILLVGRSNATAAGIGALYGWVYPDWLASEEDEATALIAPIVRAHAVSKGVVARDEAILGHGAPPTVDLTTVVRSTDMGFARCRKILSDAGVIPAGSRQGVAFAMDPDRVASALRVASKSVGRVTAAKMLGTTRHRVSDLVDEGVLRLRERGIDLTSVQEFREAIMAVCRADPPPDARGLLESCRSSGLSVAVVCSAIVACRLDAWYADKGRPDFDLRCILVSPAGVKALRPQTSMSLSFAAQTLGVHRECVRQLVSCCALRRASGRGLDHATVSRFADRHYSAARLAREAGVSPRKLISDLALSGIMPAFGPPDFRQVIYRKADFDGQTRH